MIRNLCYALFSTLLFISPQANAQKKSDDLNKSIQDVAKAFKDLFHKKKDTSVEETKNVPGMTIHSNAQSRSAGNAVLPKLGQLAPHAKAIEADDMFPFNDGAAIIRKGSSYALIDTAGNFILPYNKYSLRLVDAIISMLNGSSMNNGFFYFYDGLSKSGYLNSKGKILATMDGNYQWRPAGSVLTTDVRAPESYQAGKNVAQDIQTIITKDGKKFQFVHDDASPAIISEDIALRRHDGKYYYTTLTGKKFPMRSLTMPDCFLMEWL